MQNSGLKTVRAELDQAESIAGRTPGSVRLIAVSKEQPQERIEATLAEGHRVFGENKVQAAHAIWPALRERFGPVELHLIGPLQSNKARMAVKLFDAIHTVDREKLVQVLARLADEEGRCPELFIQVNTGREPQKAGVLPEELGALVTLARAQSLPLIGLMCIPPAADDPNPHFALLADLAAREGLARLSMGMSGDFADAVAHGATEVRVGARIFGERPRQD